jgi:hypothetical protein
MTVRCDACGTENRDKAMFCRGCAGKLPAFVATRKPAEGRSDAMRVTARTASTSAPSAATSDSASETIIRSRSGFTGPRIVVFALLMAMAGAAIAWFAMVSIDAKRQTPAVRQAPIVADRLPPEASLSAGETLDDRRASDATTAAPTPASPASDATNPATTDGISGTNPLPETASTDSEPAPSARNTNRRSVPISSGNGRASDPRAGCEHLFFAFAARCEANHCQLPAYARHPRCEVVREQRRRDDARRNSMPVS